MTQEVSHRVWISQQLKAPIEDSVRFGKVSVRVPGGCDCRMMSASNEAGVLFSHDLSVEDVADYFLTRDAEREEPDVTHLKLQKLLYFAQANYLASTDERLFDENVEAFEHGPVVYKTFRHYNGTRQILAASGTHVAPTRVHVPEDVAHFLDAVWDRYKDYSAGQLRNLTHCQDPWKHHYVENSYRTTIPDEAMATFFRQKVAAKDRVFHEAVVLVPEGFVEALDEDAIAEQMRAFWAS
ncbi:Panacea domain-containing protein [Arthrobacter globiformis]|uniref:Panacea domain-containing protein n=1 Tax=Arthrobacter globiformis TaxID=1665 RepID=UPI001124EC38|nr:type II toxin-antitoxin system antitoxin SocA domain-containing protein [Arthrobacter globiformis]